MAHDTSFTENFKLDRVTFDTIYDLHWKRVFGVCYNHCKDTEICREIVQDVFCSLWERRETLVIHGPIEHYLIKAAKYKVIDNLKSRMPTLVSMEEVEFDTLCSVESCTENEIHYHSLAEHVGELVEKLPCQCKQVYRLSRQQGMNSREIASTLLISEKTVKNHLTKALSFLRLRLDDYR